MKTPDTLTPSDSDSFQAAVLRAIPGLVLVYDMVLGQVVSANSSLQRLLGHEADAGAGGADALTGLLHPVDRERLADTAAVAERLRAGEVIESDWRLRHADGRWRVFKARAAALAGEGGRCVVLLRDVTAQRLIERELHLAAQVFENSLDGIFITDTDGLIVQVNPAFSSITGYSESQALGRKPSFLRSGLHEDMLFDQLRPRLAAGGHWQGELINRCADGSVFPAWVSISGVCRDGELIGLITTFRDLTQAKSNEERIRLLAYYDALTDLPNRALFQDRMDQELQRALRANNRVALLFLDLDHFKAINDSMGHGIGDRLLKQVAQRLVACVRASDTVARMGGDEFTILLSELSSTEQAEAAATSVAHKAMATLAEPFRLQGREVFVSTSIGVALYPRDGDTAASLLREADTAMYHAKSVGKNNYQFYDPGMSERSMARLDMQNAMHRAVRDEQFRLLFQPLIRVGGGAVVGAECLLRWGHPERGAISPADFVPVAEESGLIVPIGRWVLEESCRQFARWRAQGLKLERIAVNLSARQFADAGLVEMVIAALEAADVAPQCLELELTESILMEDVGYTLSLLQDLKSMGVRIAIDDFGTGYSSLNYLKQFPLDCLKIDRCFVEELADRDGNHGIAQAIVALARSFGLEVVAEGVETREQYEALCRLGCDQAQGYWLGRPQDAQAFLDSCRERSAEPAL